MLRAPASEVYAITPNDSASLTTHARGFLVGATGGTITFMCQRSSAPVTLTVIANTIYPIELDKVFATGTTATPLTALV